MARLLRWACAVLVLVGSGLTVSLASPAWACGCGAYIPDRSGPSIATERALIAWDGAVEDILMSFNVSGSSERAAWVMPVPSAAKVSLGDAKVFSELGRLTAPRVEYRDDWWPTLDWLASGSGSTLDTAGAPGGAAVNVLDRQRIGPFDVTRLSAGDSTALAKWLADNGFPSPDGLDENLSAYVAEHWELVAIKLASANAGEALTGDLQPLRLSFASDALVYPMRLSRSAKVPQTVDIYVLADHRMDPTSVPVAGSVPTLEFAGQLDHTTAGSELEPYLAKGTYLTRWNDFIREPQSIDGDYAFTRAEADTPYQQVRYVTRYHGDVTGLILLALAGLSVLTLVIVLVRRRGAHVR
ncbi:MULTISPECIES: DUF2330 domain-containing protein [unclassified Mycobacterium]|uniref:DUF2330 domain-containing protein n=1 Tax=unclassified Mycobacterium TaxID=2642494 RepID=UPI0029C9436A|nr:MULTISPECIES: DUF2330 domain-containing protein [unclassified Mycobacterium]